MQTLQQREIDLSIIIPVYNLEDYLEPMIDSLLDQDLGGYKVEYIFVLNNCTDDSGMVIADIGRELKPIVLNCEEHGCGCARNVGFDYCKGKYVWFLDGDDWLLKDYAIKKVLDKAYAEDLDILYIPFESIKFTWHYFSMVWQYLLKREFVEEFKFPSYQPAEDDAYMEQVLAKAGSDRHMYEFLPSMNEPLYFYNYMREGSNMYRWHVLKERKL